MEPKVAKKANPRHAGPTKREKRLAARIKDFASVSSRSGFHCPGSFNK